MRLTRQSLRTLSAALAVYVWLLLQGHELLLGRDPLTWLKP